MDTWKIRKPVEMEVGGHWEFDHYEQVGPVLHSESAVLDYALAVIAIPDMWDMEVWHYFGEVDAYGIQDFEHQDLEGWLAERRIEQ